MERHERRGASVPNATVLRVHPPDRYLASATVGYLLASAATRVTGTSLRNGIHADFGALIASLVAEAIAPRARPSLPRTPDRSDCGISGRAPEMEQRFRAKGVSAAAATTTVAESTPEATGR
jgi:hypothetical protein